MAVWRKFDDEIEVPKPTETELEAIHPRQQERDKFRCFDSLGYMYSLSTKVASDEYDFRAKYRRADLFDD
jgi:hypothetical protein